MGVYCGKLLADVGADVIKVEPMKLDKWDVGIGIIVGTWVILQILRLLVLYTGFNAWGVDPVVIVYLIVPA